MGEWGIFTGRDERYVNRNSSTGRGAGSFMAPRRTVQETTTPERLMENSERAVQWTPFYAASVHPYAKPLPYSMMGVSQASGFVHNAPGDDDQPTHGIAWYPGGTMQDGVQRVDVKAGRGRILYRDDRLPHQGPTPNMVFVPPLAHGFQTQPIYALGLP